MLHLRISSWKPSGRPITSRWTYSCGDVVVYPTDAAYAIGCQIGNKGNGANFSDSRLVSQTSICHYVLDLSDIATYAKVDNAMYRLLKNNTPVVTTFILPATRKVPKRFNAPEEKNIGLRIPG